MDIKCPVSTEYLDEHAILNYSKLYLYNIAFKYIIHHINLIHRNIHISYS